MSDFKVLHEGKNDLIDNLVKVYKNNPYYARVIFMNDGVDNYKVNRIVRFNLGSGDFDVVGFTKTFGISKTNRFYSNEKRNFTIRYRSGKFYITNKYGIKHLSINTLYTSVSNRDFVPIILDELTEEFGWIRFIHEEFVFHNLTFSSIIKYKLFNRRKALRHIFGVPYLVAKKLIPYLNKHTASSVYSIKHYTEYMLNIENLSNTIDEYDYVLFYDTLRMARMLDKKVNCSWSPKRLKEEHDSWSMEITNILYIEGDRDIKIKDIFYEFEEYSGYELIKRTKRIAFEGIKNNHCVATYVSKVESGTCAIFSLDGYTLEVGLSNPNYPNSSLRLDQMRGYGNSLPPDELISEVNRFIESFNNVNGLINHKDSGLFAELDDILPF
jgi:hypothetical protein